MATLCNPSGSSVHAIFQTSILEWVAIPFSKGSFWSRDEIQVSCTAGRFFTIWATRKPCCCLDYFIQYSCCEIYSYSYLYQYFIPFYCWMYSTLMTTQPVLVIHLLMDIWVVSSLELSQIRCHEHLYVSLNGHMLLILLSTWKWNDHVIW